MSKNSDILDAYSIYSVDPSPDNLNAVVDSLKPTINYQLSSLGATNNPVMRSKAKVYTANAIKKFDPEKAALPTFVSSQLRQLSRDMRKINTPVGIPERVQLDAYHINRSETEFIEENGREPDMAELADKSGVSIKRLQKVRETMVATPTEEAFGESLFAETAGQNMDSWAPDMHNEALEYVYHDADHVDRKILEHRLGFGGSKVMKAQDIAVKLKVSPSQVSRRVMRLSRRINEIEKALRETL